MSFNFTPLPQCLKFKKKAPPLPHSQTHSDDFIIRTKPDSAHHQNDLKDDETIIPSLDVIFRTKTNIGYNEDNNTKKNHKIKLTQIQRQHIHGSEQIMSHLGHLNTTYKNFSNISIDNKTANSSRLKLPSLNTSPHSYLIIDKTKGHFYLLSFMESPLLNILLATLKS
ncbi:hypothetical protein O181_020961 [Austropuccinia psidii MF-1]|uniref:Uncharacterized protein n=1 Tax=Austropuccinia psidii MF-1 TaxID=1389203 RepID=A0A9Q3CA23_9BASI|nr:hypothetical protein [Austropuccinia psidii MF-1]